ncbi:MAG: endo alpha-1,4 polygalactosaminidase [Eubacterium sp.]|nr:endo alpha-1,4 polygalactosaminidase [Eubacterium sp.]
MRKRNQRPICRLKRFMTLALASIMLCTVLIPCCETKAASKTDKWGVFIGATTKKLPNKIKKRQYKYVVIDAQYYNAKDIKKLKSRKCKVYSYLSIGSIANYRPYFNYFKKYTLGNYNNWTEERWVDVTNKSWQNFVVNNLVAGMRKKGIDGVWVDNTDVYYEYPRDDIFDALVSILRRIHKKRIPIIINGGDVFVEKLMETNQHRIIKGVMQEEVLTQIAGYRNDVFKAQTPADRLYYETYLKKVREKGLKISILEYTKKPAVRKSILKYCKKHGYGYYICDNVMLK